MSILGWIAYIIITFVFVVGMYFIYLRARRDQLDLRNILSRRVSPISMHVPTANVVILVAVPVDSFEENLEIANAYVT